MSKKVAHPQLDSTPRADPPEVKVARMAAWQAILVALITAVGGYLVATLGVRSSSTEKAPVVPPPEVKTVEQLPAGTDEEFELLRDMSIFDLRSWKEVPGGAKDTRYSPANYINYLHVKKLRPANKYVAHYATSGYAVDLRCITHQAAVLKRESPQDHPAEDATKEYAIEVDVSDMPLNVEFLIVIEATYWNGFQGLMEEWAATYTDADISKLGELGLIVLLPEGKPFKSYSLWTGSETQRERQYIAPHAFYADQGGHFLYWSITTRQPNSHYKLRWKW